MLNKILCLTALSAFVFGGAFADDQISEDQLVFATEVQQPTEEALLADGDVINDDEQLARCPCRDKKDNPPVEESILVCGCDDEGDEDGIVHAFSSLADDEEPNLAHHGDEGDHDLV